MSAPPPNHHLKYTCAVCELKNVSSDFFDLQFHLAELQASKLPINPNFITPRDTSIFNGTGRRVSNETEVRTLIFDCLAVKVCDLL